MNRRLNPLIPGFPGPGESASPTNGPDCNMTELLLHTKPEKVTSSLKKKVSFHLNLHEVSSHQEIKMIVILRSETHFSSPTAAD